MKLTISKFLPAVFFGAIIACSSCSKNDGPVTNRVSISEVPAITVPTDPSGSQFIPFTNQASFAGRFSVELYFPGSKPPDKVDVVIRKTNGSTINNSNQRVFRANVTTLPASFTVTVADIVALFGVPVALNDNYDFAPDIYVGAKKYEAFPLVGTGTGSGVIAMPLFKEFTRFRVQ